MQEEAAREIAAAEALEAEESSEREVLRAQRAKERLHRAAEKPRLRQQQKAAAQVKETNKVNETTEATAAISSGVAIVDDDQSDQGEVEYAEYDDEPIDELHAETGSRRKRIGLKCFNCNRLEGHYLLFYRRLWYSYLIGLTFGLAVIAGPYRCQCCGSSRFMMSNLLHPKYYLSLLSTRSKSRSSSRSSRR